MNIEGMPTAPRTEAGLTVQVIGPPGSDPAAGDAPRATPPVSTALPPDLLDEVRGRVRLLALVLCIAFAFDPLVLGIRWLLPMLTGAALDADFGVDLPYALCSGVVALASLWLWRFAGNRERSATRLLNIGLAYEVLVCLVISATDVVPYYRSTGLVPSMTWVPAVVIFFPLVLPGPPRRMLLAAILSAATGPLTLVFLDVSGRITVDPGAYFRWTVHGLFAVLISYAGARVVYGLGREVARARELGSYHLGEMLGRGGMGEVYRATHRMLARPAAIKLIRPEMIGGGDAEAARIAIRRFRREAEAAASLRSPHTVELYDFGVTAEGTFYFVMELLEGLDLETLVRREGPLPAPRVVHVLRQVCASLAEAHARSLVHRDIKPANIHIGRLGLQHDFVKVLDFGLVKSSAPDEAGQSHATGAGMAAGTPGYMAPEVALGEAVDGRADLYALGCVGYFLLTGRLVFEGGNGLQMVARHVRDQPVPPSQRTELPVPADLEALLLGCLAKEPAGRPQSALVLGRQLAELAVDPWTEAQAAGWWQAHHPA